MIRVQPQILNLNLRHFTLGQMQWLINYDMPDNLLEYMCLVLLVVFWCSLLVTTL